MNKKMLVPRILSMPFVMGLLIIPMLILYFKWIKNYFLYGGEIIAYEDEKEKGTIKEIYHLLKDTGNELYTLFANDNFTGFCDDNKQPILVGDKLKSEWGYEVIVVKDEDGDYSGKLVCDDKHSCKNIPYHINEGKGYRKIIFF